MDHYIELKLRPDPELAPYQVLGSLFGRVHHVLAATQSTTVGVSFPAVAERPLTLGNSLRLHSNRDILEHTFAGDWLLGLRDHVAQSTTLAVPPNTQFRTVSRVQAKSNPARLRRRQMRRHGLDEAQALARVPDHAVELLSLPFVQIRSQSTQQVFRLFLRHGPVVNHATPGAFSSYGLSSTATIPWF